MKNCKILLSVLFLLITSLAFAASVSYVPTVKVKAGVIATDNFNFYPYSSENPKLEDIAKDSFNLFKAMNSYRYDLMGLTPYDYNVEFINPRGDIDRSDYWALRESDISEKVLNQYDVLMFNNTSDYMTNKKISEWVQRGGILIITGQYQNLYMSNIGLFYNNLHSFDFNFNYNSPIYFNLFPPVTANVNQGMAVMGFPGFNVFKDSLFKEKNGAGPFEIVPVGNGKVIYADSGMFGNGTVDIFRNFANILMTAFSNNSARQSVARRPSTIGESLFANNVYYGDKPLVVGNSVYYVRGNKFYVDGFNLVDGAIGSAKPKTDLSRPEYMGGGDFVMYDEDGALFLCSIEFDEDKNINSNRVTWYKLYESENGCDEVLSYAPIVYNYWAYYVDNIGNLNCVYTKELEDGSAKYKWTTKGGNTSNAVLCGSPTINSRTDLYGASVTEIHWITLNDSTNSEYSYIYCTVPISVINEVSRKQPVNVEPYNQIISNYCGFPNITGNTTFKFFDNEQTTPDKVFCQLGTADIFSGNEECFVAYSNDNTSNWDYKVNYSSKGNKRNGYILLNTTTQGGVTKFSDSVATSSLKGKNPADFIFTLSYIPKYTSALRSNMIFAKGLYDDKEQETLSNGNGIVYETVQKNNTDSNEFLTFINKQNVSENRRDNSYSRYPQWSYLPHTGFAGALSPLSSEQKINIYSYVDWGFPMYTNEYNSRVYVNGITSYNNEVYVSLTASLLGNMWSRSAVVCLDGNAEPEIKIVDQDKNPVELAYNQLKKDGSTKISNYTLRLYQPAVYDSDIPYNDRAYNVNSSDVSRGIIKIGNMNNFKRANNTQMITSALPIFVSVEYNLVEGDGQRTKTYLPIFPGTCPTLDITDYNNKIGDVVIPVIDGNGNNVNKKVYVDLSDWNMVKWYSVLPGNTEIFGKPIVTGDNVTLFGYEKDEYNKNIENRIFTIKTKGNVQNGVKIREESIKVAKAGNDLKFNDKLQISNGVNNVAVANGNKIYVFDNKKNLVVDGNTLKEIDASGNVTWTLNEFSSWEGNNYNLENPVRARYVFNNSYIAVADGSIGNIYIINKMGKVKSTLKNDFAGNTSWIINEFEDIYGLLRSGASLKLGFISDFVFWTEAKGSDTLNHFLVADSTNKRVLDLVVVTDSTGAVKSLNSDGKVMPYLNWVTYDVIPGNKNNFVSIDITEKIIDAFGNTMRAVVAGVANYNTSDRNGIKKSKGGSVVIYDYRMEPSNSQVENQETHNKRYGRFYDSIGKQGDILFDDLNDGLTPYISGLKKVVIANLDGRDFIENELKNYNELQIIICDEFGANQYYINSIQNYNGMISYYWKIDYTKSVSSKFFGIEDPNYDRNIVSFDSEMPSFLPGRFKPFTSNYYSRVPNGDPNYRTDYAPLKVPLIPVDLKVLSNGNWLILNGYSGNVKFIYRNPFDGINYEIDGKYNGEPMEIGFNQDLGIAELYWTGNQMKSFAIDDYVYVGNPTEEQIANWNRVLDDMDVKVYSPYNSPIGYENNIIGGFKYLNKTLKTPRSIDR